MQPLGAQQARAQWAAAAARALGALFGANPRPEYALDFLGALRLCPYTQREFIRDLLPELVVRNVHGIGYLAVAAVGVDASTAALVARLLGVDQRDAATIAQLRTADHAAGACRLYISATPVPTQWHEDLLAGMLGAEDPVTRAVAGTPLPRWMGRVLAYATTLADPTEQQRCVNALAVCAMWPGAPQCPEGAICGIAVEGRKVPWTTPTRGLDYDAINAGLASPDLIVDHLCALDPATAASAWGLADAVDAVATAPLAVVSALQSMGAAFAAPCPGTPRAAGARAVLGNAIRDAVQAAWGASTGADTGRRHRTARVLFALAAGHDTAADIVYDALRGVPRVEAAAVRGDGADLAVGAATRTLLLGALCGAPGAYCCADADGARRAHAARASRIAGMLHAPSCHGTTGSWTVLEALHVLVTSDAPDETAAALHVLGHVARSWSLSLAKLAPHARLLQTQADGLVTDRVLAQAMLTARTRPYGEGADVSLGTRVQRTAAGCANPRRGDHELLWPCVTPSREELAALAAWAVARQWDAAPAVAWPLVLPCDTQAPATAHSDIAEWARLCIAWCTRGKRPSNESYAGIVRAAVAMEGGLRGAPVDIPPPRVRAPRVWPNWPVARVALRERSGIATDVRIPAAALVFIDEPDGADDDALAADRLQIILDRVVRPRPVTTPGTADVHCDAMAWTSGAMARVCASVGALCRRLAQSALQCTDTADATRRWDTAMDTLKAWATGDGNVAAVARGWADDSVASVVVLELSVLDMACQEAAVLSVSRRLESAWGVLVLRPLAGASASDERVQAVVFGDDARPEGRPGVIERMLAAAACNGDSRAQPRERERVPPFVTRWLESRPLTSRIPSVLRVIRAVCRAPARAASGVLQDLRQWMDNLLWTFGSLMGWAEQNRGDSELATWRNAALWGVAYARMFAAPPANGAGRIDAGAMTRLHSDLARMLPADDVPALPYLMAVIAGPGSIAAAQLPALPLTAALPAVVLSKLVDAHVREPRGNVLYRRWQAAARPADAHTADAVADAAVKLALIPDGASGHNDAVIETGRAYLDACDAMRQEPASRAVLAAMMLSDLHAYASGLARALAQWKIETARQRLRVDNAERLVADSATGTADAQLTARLLAEKMREAMAKLVQPVNRQRERFAHAHRVACDLARDSKASPFAGALTELAPLLRADCDAVDAEMLNSVRAKLAVVRVIARKHAPAVADGDGARKAGTHTTRVCAGRWLCGDTSYACGATTDTHDGVVCAHHTPGAVHENFMCQWHVTRAVIAAGQLAASGIACDACGCDIDIDDDEPPIIPPAVLLAVAAHPAAMLLLTGTDADAACARALGSAGDTAPCPGYMTDARARALWTELQRTVLRPTCPACEGPVADVQLCLHVTHETESGGCGKHYCGVCNDWACDDGGMVHNHIAGDRREPGAPPPVAASCPARYADHIYQHPPVVTGATTDYNMYVPDLAADHAARVQQRAVQFVQRHVPGRLRDDDATATQLRRAFHDYGDIDVGLWMNRVTGASAPAGAAHKGPHWARYYALVDSAGTRRLRWPVD